MRALALFATLILTAAAPAAAQQSVLRQPELRAPAVITPPAQPQQQEEDAESDQPDSTSEFGQQDMLWMQRLMDQKGEQEEEISRTMREVTETESSVAGALKDD